MIDYEIRCIPKIGLNTTHGVLKAAECKTLSKRPNAYLCEPSSCYRIMAIVETLFSLDYPLEYDKKSYK